MKYFDLITSRNITFGQFFSFTALLLPDLITFIIPFIFSVGCIYAYFQLLYKKELKVMLTLGFSKPHLTYPILYIALLCVAIQIAANFISPIAFNSFLEKEQQIRNQITLAKFKPNQFNTIDKHILFFDKKTNNSVVKNIFIAFYKNEKNVFITASQGSLKNNILQLKDGFQIEEDIKNKTFTTLSFEEFEYHLPDFNIPYARILKEKWLSLFTKKSKHARHEAFIKLIKIILPLLSIPIIVWGIFFRHRFMTASISAVSFNMLIIAITKFILKIVI